MQESRMCDALTNSPHGDMILLHFKLGETLALDVK